MPSPSEQLQYQVGTLSELMAGVKADQWGDPTPCANWTVRDLATHLVGGGTMFAASFRGDTIATGADGEQPDVLGDDPAAAFDRVITEFESAVETPGAMERDVTLPFATLPAQVALDIAKFDLLMHAWDLARATDQALDPPANVVDEARATAEMIVDGLRDGDTFRAATEAPVGASSIDQLAAFAGRTV